MKRIYILAAAALALVACDNNEDNQLSSNEALQITASIGKSTLSRADDADATPIPGDHDSWVEGDCIGITATVGDVVGPFINYQYKYESAIGGDEVKFSGNSIFFYKPMILTAYYPFTGEQGTVPGIIEANTGVANQSEENRPKIDFLWDCKKGKGVDKDQVDFSISNPNVEFTFAHKMSKLSFAFQSSEPVPDPKKPGNFLTKGVDVRTMISYKIEGLGIEGTFDTATGVCAFDEQKGRPGIEMKDGKDENTELTEDQIWKYTREYPPLIVFPQVKPTGEDFMLRVTTDELNDQNNLQNYNCALRFTDDQIKSGCHYKFTIKVTKLGLIVGDLTIEPWSPEEKFLTATIDGDNPFKE